MQSYTWLGGVPNSPPLFLPQQYRLLFILPGPFVIAHAWASPTEIAIGITPVPKSTAILVLALPTAVALLPTPCMRFSVEGMSICLYG
jgi:hypothetical protein